MKPRAIDLSEVDNDHPLKALEKLSPGDIKEVLEDPEVQFKMKERLKEQEAKSKEFFRRIRPNPIDLLEIIEGKGY